MVQLTVLHRADRSSGGSEFTLSGLGNDSTPGDSRSLAGKLGVSGSSNMLALASDVELVHVGHGILNGRAGQEPVMPSGEMRILPIDVEVGGEEIADGIVVVLDEGEVGNSAFVSDKPGLLAEDVVENAKDALDFTLEPHDGRRKALGMIEHEPLGITKGRALSGGLVEEPGVHVSLLFLVDDEELLVSVESLSNILEDGVALPDDLVVVGVVNKGGDTTVGVELAILLGLVLLLGKVKDHLVVRETKLFHENDELEPVKTGLGEVESKLRGRHCEESW